MNQAKCDLIFADINAAFREIERKHGLTPSSIRGGWNSEGLKVNVTVLEATSKAASVALEAGIRTDPKLLNHLKNHGWKFGLKVDHLGKEFKIGSSKFIFTGMSSAQYAIGQDVLDGKHYKLDPRKCALGLNAVAA